MRHRNTILKMPEMHIYKHKQIDSQVACHNYYSNQEVSI